MLCFQGRYKLDIIDKKILKILSKNARTDYVELSENLKLAPNTIRNRIKQLERVKIIEQYTISIDFKKLNKEFYNIQIKKSNKQLTILTEYLKQQQNTIYYYVYVDNEYWDLDIGLLIENSTELRKVILDLKKEFAKIITIHDIYVITEIYKDNVAPKCLFN